MDAEKGRQLWEAARKSDMDGIRRLLQEGAPVNWTGDWGGWTPLHLAARNENGTPEMVEALVRAGAEVHAKTNDGETPLHSEPRRTLRLLCGRG
uniref:Uncharacterized protein n=1 Tax=Chromera velia CCMP2878 TaxID=1169474 RepID=A0A0G4G9Y1_9ALVE|eukprot:Cvel_20945.t1-p1 / transcript=Cvel_20945.t1 / gene=Cvel_20945 / organism=Chromera_velia_CCMP2878 / gene_product=GA-binding protein subunit beta-2, putative / transcript_product=GA-binding protein subunit beta-2, putative / location=Cvel_scaffold1924:17527-20130(+) / protein_length=93 / sequence_SO=supercontig / SO=protein_coding / is_pseudo=false